jgi:hypothetical protein
VRKICGRYGIPYNSGPLSKQFGSVVKKICRLALPDRKRDESGRPGQLEAEAETNPDRVPVTA